MINNRDKLALEASAFTLYESYIDAEPMRNMNFLSEEAKLHFMRYVFLYAMYHNFAKNVQTQKFVEKDDKDSLESDREHGEAALIANIIRDALLSGQINLTKDISEEIFRVWDDSLLDEKILNNELSTNIHGDAYYHLYTKRPGTWRVETIDPRQVIIQHYNREITHLIIWDVLSNNELDDVVLHVLEYRLVPNTNNDDNECEWRESQWTVDKNPDQKSLKFDRLPFKFAALKDGVDILRMKGLVSDDETQLREVIKEQGLPQEEIDERVIKLMEGMVPWYPFMLNGDRRSDFIPIIHIPNIDSGEVFGLSDYHRALNVLMDLGPTNKKIHTGIDLLALPPIAVDSAHGGFSDMKGVQKVGADGQQRREAPVVKRTPGDIFRGKLSMVDTSKIFIALLSAKKDLYKTLFSVTQIPEIAFGPSELKIPSGKALEIMFRPLIQVVENKRIGRSHKYKLLIKFIGKAVGTPIESKRGDPVPISFGDIKKWIQDVAKELMLANTSKVINVQETRDHLVKSSVLDETLLDPDFETPVEGLTPTEAFGEESTSPNNDQGVTT